MRNKKSPTDLAFVGRKSSKKPLSFWTIPPTGDYLHGTKVGAAMAASYAAYLAGAVDLAPILPQIVLDMLGVEGLPDGLQGQVVGFFSALEGRLALEATKQRG